MPVLNGATFLPAQFESLAAQTACPGQIIVSDDGSDDGSMRSVQKFAQEAPFGILCVDGPRRGYASNVMSLLSHAGSGVVGFCDQDDVWSADRIEVGLKSLANLDGPALHVVAREGFGGGWAGSRLHRRHERSEDSFATALLRNRAPANATLLNAEAVTLVRRGAARLGAPPAFPDWWIYGLVTGAGGTVLQDPRPGVWYRSHRGNLLGDAGTPRGAVKRLRSLASGRYGGWLRENTRALEACADLLTPTSQARLRQFAAALEAGRTADWLALGDRGSDCETMLLKIVASFGLI